MPRRRLALTIIGVTLALGATVAIVGSQPFQALCCAREWRRYPQPGGSYTIVVHRIPRPFGMPGQSSDAPGIVQFVNARNEVEQSTKVEMVQNVSEPEWSGCKESTLVRISG